MGKQRQDHADMERIKSTGEREDKSDRPVIVIGVGASAGGLKSINRLFADMPTGHGVAFVLIQHRDPAQENLTVRLLSGKTALSAVEATDGMPILPDRIHVMPPDRFLNITGAVLSLQEPVYCNGLRMPIDHFFCSLAVAWKNRCCGIVLSGTGTDGTLGLSEIRAAGGRTLVEDPGEAEFPAMPQNAIDAGKADRVLPADAMAEVISAMAKEVMESASNAPSRSAETNAVLRPVLDILRAKVGHDFSCYKPTTLVRRIRRRMALERIETFDDYFRFLNDHPGEVRLLQRDLQIGVTEFFRQPQAWKVLQEKVIAALVEEAEPRTEIRVWVPGCSTGKEAYSIAMLLAEQTERSGKQAEFRVFATDTDEDALATARGGAYSEEEISGNITPERLERFFERKDGLYQVAKWIRGAIVFAPQNLTSDPPFSRLDLISCRNLLIYLDQQIQKKIIPLFHFALREGGFLFLGTAENVGDRQDLFEPVSRKWKIYRRIGVGRITQIPVYTPQAISGKAHASGSAPKMSLALAAKQILVDRFAPASVIIDRKLQVVYVHGPVEKYLTLPAGEMSTLVVDMAREGMQARLRAAIGKCMETGRSVSITARAQRGEKSLPIKATITPLKYPKETDGLLLITFEDYPSRTVKSRSQATGRTALGQLEDELKVTREELQSTIEQLCNSNDELKASNEEVTAANEELQSANEELEASKEELQSLNDELNAVNARLQEKVDELESTNNDVLNLLSSTNIATVFLDKELKVRRYTPASTNLFSLISSDVGRPISDILRRFSDDALLEDATRVLADLASLSKEVQVEDGQWYIRRITPYRTHDDRIEGVVITFVDVCDLKETEQALRRERAELEKARAEAENERRRLEAMMAALPVGVAITDLKGVNIRSNGAFENVWGRTRPPAESVGDYAAYKGWWVDTGKPVRPEDWASARAVQKGETVVGQLLEIQRFDGARAFVLNSASPVRDAEGKIVGSAVAIQDITELRKAQEEMVRLASFPLMNPEPVTEVDLDGRVFFTNTSAERLFPDLQARGTDHPWLSNWESVARACRRPSVNLPAREVRVGDRWYHQTMYCVQETLRVRIYGIDITDRKQAEEALRESEDMLKRAQAIAHLGSWELDLGSNRLTWSDEVYRIFGFHPQEFGATYEAFLEAVHPEDRAAVDEAYSGSLREGRGSYEIEHRAIRRSDGEIRVVHEKCEHIRDASGRIIRSVGMVHDVTERKQSEERIRRQNKVLKAINQIFQKALTCDTEEELGQMCLTVVEEMTGSRFGFIGEIGPDGTLHDIAISTLGWDACKMYDKTGHRRPRGNFKIHGLYGRVLQDGKGLLVNDPASHPDSIGVPEGHPPLASFLGVPLLQGGKTVGMVAVGNREGGYAPEQQEKLEAVAPAILEALARERAEEALRKAHDELEVRVQERTRELADLNEELRVEVEERTRAEEALSEEKKRLYDVLETLPVYVVLLTPDYHVPFANRFFRERFGESRGMRCFEYLFGRTEPCEACETNTVMRTRAPHHWERTGPDNRNYDVFDFPFKDTDGSPLIMEVGIDITERKRAEAELRAYTVKLEQSNRDLEDFAYVASHDLQEPLRKIQTFADRLLTRDRECLNDNAKGYLERMGRSAGRMQALVLDLLAYSRITSRPEPFTRFPLHEAVEEAATDVAMLRGETGGKVELGRLPEVEADRAQMRQLFQNLIINGLKYHGERKPLIRIYSLPSPETPYWEIRVEDNGIGFDECYLEKIFKPFQRLHAMNSPYPGTGMGLAICRRIVERHGGSITATSRPGEGATFIVRLPKEG